MRKNFPVKSILFDMGDIFFDAHSWRKWNYEYLYKNRYFLGSFEDFYKLYEKFLIPVYLGKKKYDDAYLNFYKQFDIIDFSKFLRSSMKMKKLIENDTKLYRNVKRTLSLIKKHNILNVIISDSEKKSMEIREKILKKHKINSLIDFVFSSSEIGYVKPEKGFFDFVLSNLNLSKNEVIFVAHDIDEINGAVEYGIKTVEFNNFFNNKTKAHYRINSFNQLLKIIKINDF